MKNRHGLEQIIRILGELERSGLKISEARRLKELQTENDRLKKLVPDQALDIQILKEVNAKNGNTTHQKLVDLSGAHFW
jgi:hypothetical protein